MFQFNYISLYIIFQVCGSVCGMALAFPHSSSSPQEIKEHGAKTKHPPVDYEEVIKGLIIILVNWLMICLLLFLLYCTYESFKEFCDWCRGREEYEEAKEAKEVKNPDQQKPKKRSYKSRYGSIGHQYW